LQPTVVLTSFALKFASVKYGQISKYSKVTCTIDGKIITILRKAKKEDYDVNDKKKCLASSL